MREPQIIGLAGRMGSGKDAVAEMLKAYDYERVAFADTLRAEVDHAIRVGAAPDSMPTDMQDDMLRANAADVWAKPTSEKMRRILQWWGTELGRNQRHPDYWVWRLAERLHTTSAYVVSDCRFPNEVDWIHKAGGAVWWIERETQIGGIPNHISEQLTSESCDRIIDNTGTLDELRVQIETIIANSAFAIRK